jgi:hypothetical protein
MGVCKIGGFKKQLTLMVITVLVLSSFIGLIQVQQVQSQTLTDTSIATLSGKDWSLKIDSTLNTQLDSKNVPYISSPKSSEKELFVNLNSLKDCTSGVVQFKVATQGLTIYKQLPLDQELKLGEQYDFINATVAMKKGVVIVSRPENVVNSFACFDASGMKVLHIYASKLIDAKGNSVWVDSDLKDGLLTVVLDSKFLESAVFPVVVDPTFGYTSQGGSDSSLDTDRIRGSKITATETGTVTKLSVWLKANSAFTGHVKAALYDAILNTTVGVSGEVDVSYTTSYALWEFPCDISILPTNYIAVIWVDYTSIPIYSSCDTDINQDYIVNIDYGDAFPSPITWGFYLARISIYATYSTSTDNYTNILTINEPENIQYNSSSVAWDVSQTGNDTGLSYQVGFWNQTGANWVGSNSTLLTGTKTGLTNGTYTFGVKATGANTVNYATIDFTVMFNETSEEPTPTPTSTPTVTINTANLDIIIYILIISILIIFAIIAFKYLPILGALGGLLGAIFSYIALTSQNMIIQTVWNETAQTWVQQLYPMGFFAYVPVILTAVCFMIALKKK